MMKYMRIIINWSHGYCAAGACSQTTDLYKRLHKASTVQTFAS